MKIKILTLPLVLFTFTIWIYSMEDNSFVHQYAEGYEWATGQHVLQRLAECQNLYI
jgi:hypothetical protein